jgi:hypothetical protein
MERDRTCYTRNDLRAGPAASTPMFRLSTEYHVQTTADSRPGAGGSHGKRRVSPKQHGVNFEDGEFWMSFGGGKHAVMASSDSGP